MGFWLNDKEGGDPAPRAVNNMLQKLRRLYEQTRHLSASQRQVRVAQYLSHWLRWANSEPLSAVRVLKSQKVLATIYLIAATPVSAPLMGSLTILSILNAHKNTINTNNPKVKA
ncbi:hypothetical protein A6J66_000945 [Yersinia enterocolitica]|nr:hypothetical protein A6J66_000945 [Yersinia enterocolitica]